MCKCENMVIGSAKLYMAANLLFKTKEWLLIQDNMSNEICKNHFEANLISTGRNDILSLIDYHDSIREL